MLKETLRKIEYSIIEYFDGDQIELTTDEHSVSLTIISDTEKDRIITAEIDTNTNTVSITNSFELNGNLITIYYIKIVDSEIKAFDPITSEVRLPDITNIIANIIRDDMDNQ